VKEELLGTITQLPDNVSFDDVMYSLYVIDKVRKGKEAIERGKTISVEDQKMEMNEW